MKKFKLGLISYIILTVCAFAIGISYAFLIKEDSYTYIDKVQGYSFSYPTNLKVEYEYHVNGDVSRVILDNNKYSISMFLGAAQDVSGKFGSVLVTFDGKKYQAKVSNENIGYETVDPVFMTDSGLSVFNGAIKGKGWGKFTYLVVLPHRKYLVIEGPEPDDRILLGIVKSIQPPNITQVKYTDPEIGSFYYPSDFIVRRSTVNDILRVSIHPQPEPTEFGSSMLLTVREYEDDDLVAHIKKLYKDAYVSNSIVNINGRDWVEAVIIDSYFETMIHKYYFTKHSEGKYLEVVFSKDQYDYGFTKILESIEI
jgi:hypothetical protein